MNLHVVDRLGREPAPASSETVPLGTQTPQVKEDAKPPFTRLRTISTRATRRVVRVLIARDTLSVFSLLVVLASIWTLGLVPGAPVRDALNTQAAWEPESSQSVASCLLAGALSLIGMMALRWRAHGMS